MTIAVDLVRKTSKQTNISDNNKHRICSKVNIDRNIKLLNSQVRLNGKCCALVDSSQPAMAMLSGYSGSLAQHLT